MDSATSRRLRHGDADQRSAGCRSASKPNRLSPGLRLPSLLSGAWLIRPSSLEATAHRQGTEQGHAFRFARRNPFPLVHT